MKSWKYLFFTVFLVLLVILVKAQGGSPGDLPPDVDAPIDGGLSLLVAAGVGYGAKKLKEKRNKNGKNTINK